MMLAVVYKLRTQLCYELIGSRQSMSDITLTGAKGQTTEGRAGDVTVRASKYRAR